MDVFDRVKAYATTDEQWPIFLFGQGIDAKLTESGNSIRLG